MKADIKNGDVPPALKLKSSSQLHVVVILVVVVVSAILPIQKAMKIPSTCGNLASHKIHLGKTETP
jgi:uncharacterized membrane protein YqhA